MGASVDGLGDLDGVLDHLDGAAARVRERGPKLVRAAGLAIESSGKVHAPVLTGATRASIGMDVLDGGLTVEVGPTTSYARYPHDGTSKIRPNPYMTNALNRHLSWFEGAAAQLGEDCLG